MKTQKTGLKSLYMVGIFSSMLFASSCVNASVAEKNDTTVSHGNNPIPAKKRTVKQATKDYWYDGKAELSSYKLTQARYGETHEGTAVLVYVTEPFSKGFNTKADEDRKDNVPVLKLNMTKKFNTGIYPYSMMNSTFFPLENGNASLKIASSLQEWCGMTYLEMKNEETLKFNFDSYFEGFTFKDKAVEKELLEDDLWSLIRLNPELLPEGKVTLIPSMFFLRLRNRDVEAHTANIKLHKDAGGVNRYELTYPELERTLIIKFNDAFPHQILGWEETHYSGYGEEKNLQTSSAELMETVKTDYWNQNHNKDKHWRGKLGL